MVQTLLYFIKMSVSVSGARVNLTACLGQRRAQTLPRDRHTNLAETGLWSLRRCVPPLSFISFLSEKSGGERKIPILSSGPMRVIECAKNAKQIVKD